MADMRAFHATSGGLQRDGIAARQVRALREIQPGVKLHHIRELFALMRDDIDAS
jgi:hypothetical protein